MKNEEAVRKLMDTPEEVGESLDGIHKRIYDIVNGKGEDTKGGVQ